MQPEAGVGVGGMRCGAWMVGGGLLLLLACSESADLGSNPAVASDIIEVVAVGDMACGTDTPPGFPCQSALTASIATAIGPDAVLALGDLQYESGELEDFQRFYEPTWGVFKNITYPTSGNHEYETPGASGYFDYFNAVGVDSGRAGHRARGWYAFRLGTWLLVALNSNCAQIGGCDAGSPQEQWLRTTLAANPALCTLAFMHHPRFSSAERGTVAVAPLWKDLQDFGADLILAGHDHIYERFGPLTSTGVSDAQHGIRSFVLGTGGKNVYGFGQPIPGSEASYGHAFGVLRLVLHPDRYTWQFYAAPGTPFTDSGAAPCR